MYLGFIIGELTNGIPAKEGDTSSLQLHSFPPDFPYHLVHGRDLGAKETTDSSDLTVYKIELYRNQHDSLERRPCRFAFVVAPASDVEPQPPLILGHGFEFRLPGSEIVVRVARAGEALDESSLTCEDTLGKYVHIIGK